MSANRQLLRRFIEQHDAAILQMKVVADDGENLVKDLVEIEGRQYRLTGVVEDGNALHSEPKNDGVGKNCSNITLTWAAKRFFVPVPKF